MSASHKHEHIVVIGASIAGLLAAGAASKTFRRVTVLERDELEDVAEPRKGVPQGNQIHALLPVGLERMEMVFPGLREELVDVGGKVFDELANVGILTSVGWMVRTHGVQWVACRRPLLELVVRKRLAALPNVEIRHASVAGLAVAETSNGKKVSGVKLRDGSVVEADFVINATGRRTKAPEWLAEHGVAAPRESFVNAYIGYSTQFVRLPEDAFEHGLMGIGALPWPGEHRGVALFPADNGLHALTAIGAMRDYPSRDREEIIEFLSSGVCPLAGEIARKAELVGEINTYHVEGSLLRHWKEIKGLPDRFITIGDAAASMNPIFGQGMSLSATAGMILQNQFAAAETLDGVAARIHNELAPVLESAFAVVGANDAAFEGAVWSSDYKPMSDAEKEHGLALTVLTTQRPEISYALNMALYSLRPEDLGAEHVTEACNEWLKGDRVIPKFDRNKYPAQVIPREEAVLES